MISGTILAGQTQTSPGMCMPLHTDVTIET